MLSITIRRGGTIASLVAVAHYLDESREKENDDQTIEDYYSHGSLITPSQWMGSAAAELGLSGQVAYEDHLRTLQGHDPQTGAALVQKAGVNRRYAYDLTFSSPKSVSIAWALSEESVRRGIEVAHERAVERTLKFIEEKMSLGRRGSAEEGTLVYVKVRLLVAAFRHGSSRELDPQLHTHAMLQNLGLRSDQTWGSLDPKELFEWKQTLGALYRAELASELRQNLGFLIEPDREYFRISGIPQELEQIYSKRREQIESALLEKGLVGGKASEVAALDTRKTKKLVAATILREKWRTLAAEHGITPDYLDSLRKLEKGRGDQESFVLERQEIFRSLTRKGLFQEKDLFLIVGRVCSWSGRGIEDIKREVSSLLSDPEIVVLPGKDQRLYYTTKKILSFEEEIVQKAREGKEDTRHVLPGTMVRAAIARVQFENDLILSEAQRKAIEHLTTRVGRIQILEGHKSTEKRMVLTIAHQLLEAQGIEVVRSFLPRKTADGVEQNTGIRSQPLMDLLREVKGYQRKDGVIVPATKVLTDKTVVFLEEASMNSTRLMTFLIRETEKVKGKVILVGNERQIPPVSRGNLFKSLQKELGFASLAENSSQKVSRQKEISQEVRNDQVKSELLQLLNAGMIYVAKNQEEAIQKTLEYWSSRYNPELPGKVRLTAYRELDVRALNERARKEFQEKGRLSGPRIETMVMDQEGKSAGRREFQAGDRLYFKKDNRTLGITSEETGTLKAIDVTRDGRECTFLVTMDKGKEIRFDPRDYAQIDHGYAITTPKAPKENIEFSSDLVAGMSLNALYHYLSRHRERQQIVIMEEQIDRLLLPQNIDLTPTERMIESVHILAKKLALSFPDGWDTDFDTCRRLLEMHAEINLDGEIRRQKTNFGLEKLRAILAPSQARERINILNFIINEGEKIREQGREHEIQEPLVKDLMVGMKQHQEKSFGEKAREQEQEYELGLGLGFELGFDTEV